jgi:7,8-dihydroneopterin aldolase/epimerase/oxygenase
MSDKILLCGAQFFAHHGVGDDERQVGGRYTVDVEVDYDLLRAGTSDQLADTISYSQVYDRVRTLVERSSFRLVEALAEAIAADLLAHFPAPSVRVRVTKTPPPIAGIVAAAGVEVVRTRRVQ